MPAHKRATQVAHERTNMFVEIVLEAIKDGRVDPHERAIIRGAASDTLDSTREAHQRSQLGMALLGGAADVEYLRELGAPIGIGIEAA